MNEYRIYRRQFYLGSEAIALDENWSYRKTDSGKYLSFCSSLPVSVIRDRKANEWILLGDAIQTGAGDPSPSQMLEAWDGVRPITDIYTTWSGRWLLIGQGEIHLDASGLLGCYYTISDKGVSVSSIPFFLTRTEIPDTFRLRKAVGIENYSLPDSGFKKVRKLLPSQILNLNTGLCEFRDLKINLPDLSEDELMQRMEDYLVNTSLNAYNYFGKRFVLALTAGYDSRLLMASLQKAGIPYETLTFQGPYMAPCDRTVPPRLAAIADVSHAAVEQRVSSNANRNKYNVHSCYHAVERDRELIEHGQFEAIPAGEAVLLRGGCFEVATCPYERYLPKEIPDGNTVAGLLKGNATQAASIDKWIEWIKEHPVEELDWRDRYYWEQRIAGWLSSTEQALDLVNIDRFVPANSTYFFNLLLRMPFEMRRKKQHQVDLIRRMAPELLKLPFNPKSSRIVRQWRKILFRYERITQEKKLPLRSYNPHHQFRHVKLLIPGTADADAAKQQAV